MRRPALETSLSRFAVILGFCLSLLVSVRPLAALPGGDDRTVAPKVFFDCSQRECDLDFIRQETPFVSFVMDRENADLHVMVTRRRTGAGGSEYTLSFIGLGRHQGRNELLKYNALPTQSDDETRKGMAGTLKKGLVPYMYDTPLSEYISVSYTGGEASVRERPHDPWNAWVYRLGVRGHFDMESLSRGNSLDLSLSANRTTEASKFVIWLNGNFENRLYVMANSDDIKSRTESKTFYSRYIKSLGGHWSAGLFAHIYTSTYDNAKLFTTLGPGLEFNLFPYQEATRRELRFQYRFNLTDRRYIEETLYNKTGEFLLNHSLGVILEIKEPWGNAGVMLEGQHYLHDLSLSRIKFEGGLSMRLSKGLSCDIDLDYSRIGDQISLPKAEASLEEILLSLKRQATSYHFRMKMGLSFRFGSMYSSVVNSRFDQ
jgi:hypothetical protein